MDETVTYVVQPVRGVPEEQRYDHRLLQSVRGTPCEPNPGDAPTDLSEPMLIVPQLPDVEPTTTKTYRSDKRGTRNVYIRKTDLEKFGYTAGCPACEVHRAGLPMPGQGYTAECRKRLEDAMTTATSTATRVKATRVRQAERTIKGLDDSGWDTPAVQVTLVNTNASGFQIKSTWVRTREGNRNADLWSGGIRDAPTLNAWKRKLQKLISTKVLL